MGRFSRNKKIDGLMSIGLLADGVSVAHIKRQAGSMPVVESLVFQSTDKASLPASLEKLGKDLHAERYAWTTVLGSGEYQLLSVDAPTVPADELKTAIRWRLKDMLDFHVDDATIDVLDVPVDKNGPSRTHSMYAIAARNQLIEQRQNLFADAKIPLSVIDIPEMAQRNVSAMMEPEGRGVAMLSFGPDGGLLTVTFSGELYLSRRLDVTVTQLNPTPGEEENPTYGRITLELQRSLDHFERQYHFITVAKLVLAPLPVQANGLKDYLSTNLYLPVEILNLESLLDLSKVPELRSPELQQRYFMTLGAGLRLEEKVL